VEVSISSTVLEDKRDMAKTLHLLQATLAGYSFAKSIKPRLAAKPLTSLPSKMARTSLNPSYIAL